MVIHLGNFVDFRQQVSEPGTVPPPRALPLPVVGKRHVDPLATCVAIHRFAGIQAGDFGATKAY